MPRWTDAQQEAIDNRGRNLLVSAAAGSGKTAVLVERIIGLIIKDNIDIDKLLIVTFTNAAAGEMRERILKAITDEIEKGTDREEDLRRQVHLLNKASITTVHSFCINVVRRNFHLIGIDPAFRIGDSTETKIIIQEVLEELLEREYEKGHEDYIRLVEGFGGNKNDAKLEEIILRLYSFIQSKPYPEKWLEESVESFNVNMEELEESLWIKTIKDSIFIDLSGARDLITEAIALANSINGPITYLDALNSDLNNIDELEKTLKTQDLASFNEKLKALTHDTLKRVSKDVDEDIKKEVQDLRKKYKEDIIEKSLKSGLLSKDIHQYLREINILHPIMKYLYSLIVDFSQMYRERKLEKSILDFNDLEHYTLEILENQEVRDNLREKYEYIFIDEYQDSNIVQETIIDRIKRDNNLFFVGDVKQSIYRFRLADPSLFLEKYNRYSKDDSSSNKRIDLSQNFRSRWEILDGVNYIFKNIMSKDLGEIQYDEDAYLYKGAEYGPIDDTSIEINLIEKQEVDLEDIDEELQEMEDVEVEAKVVAQKIKDVIGKKTYNVKAQKYEDITYKDIVILLRATKNWSSTFTEVFAKEGIPVYADDNSGYFDVLEIKIFLNLLSVIDNKRQDIPLLSVMKSSIGRFTTDELIRIRINNKKGTYFEAIEEYISSNNDDLKDKLVKLIDNINYWSEESRYLKMDEFIWRLMLETGYYHYVGAMPGGAQRQANLRILVDRASQFERTSINGLFNFIRFIDKLQGSSGDMGTAKTLSESENVVRIMSIHKSKGLEFPVVICAGLGKNFNLMDTRSDILLHKDLGLGPKFVDIDKRRYTESLPQIAMKKKMKLESLSEEMRILYVALTRPKDKLILVGSIRNIEKECNKWCRGTTLYNLANGKNYLDWILSTLSRHVDGEILRNTAKIDISEDKIDPVGDSRWKITILNRGHILREEAQILKEVDEYKKKLEDFSLDTEPSITDEINRRFTWSYGYEDSTKIPTKLSVSDIKKTSLSGFDNIGYNIPSLVKMPKFLEGKKPFTKAEQGTIVHFVMQHLDLSLVHNKDSINSQIDKMVLEELITDEEAKVVDVEKVYMFFQSHIGQKILKASKVYREQPFVLRKKASDTLRNIGEFKEDLLIQGIIDCYFEDGEDLVLVDYKTDFIEETDTEKLINRYKGQLDIYKEALERITKKRVKESYIYSFELDREVLV